GGNLVEPRGGKRPPQAGRRRFPRAPTLRAAPRARPGPGPRTPGLRRAHGHTLYPAVRQPSAQGARFQPAPRRRRHQHGRNLDPAGRPGPPGPCRLHDERQHPVFDHDAWRYTDFVAEFNRLFEIDQEHTERVKHRVHDFLRNKKPGDPDSDDLLQIKGLIRQTEARAAALACGIPPEQLRFMNLRFYRTGTIAKAPIHPDDIRDIIALLQELQPAQIYVAGDLSDPHGTHRVCADAIFQAAREVRRQGQQFEVWMYRGAWQEWEPHEIERVVPLSPDDLERKKLAIFRHQSQKDRAMFPGSTDPREFWQRAEDRNLHTAKVFDDLGLPEFYALEGFVRWNGTGEW